MSTDNLGYVAATITAENQFTPFIQTTNVPYFNFSLSGTFVATVTIQRRFRVTDSAWGEWLDMEEYTEPREDIGIIPASERIQLRAGVKTGDFTSGSAVLRISR